eukprot:s422_g8.t2
MLSHGGDEFWELHRRLGECYRTDVYRSAGFGESSQAMRRFRAAVGEDAGGIKVKSAWGGQTPVEPLPPRSFKSVGPTPEPPDLPAFVMDTFQRQISNPVSSKSKARWSDPAFKDDFVRAVQRKVTFDVQSANAPIEARKTATLTSKDLEAMVTVNPEEAMRFEPREYWRRQGSNPHLAAASATHKVFNSSRRHRGFSSVSVGRSSWTSVLSGVENFLIHPNGRFRSIWSLFGMLFLTWDVVVIPLRFFDIPRSAFSDVMLWLTLVYWNLDILISFLTGYYYKGMLVMRFSNVVSNYLRSWFLLDLTVVCVDWAMTIVALADEGDGATGVARLSKSLRLLHFLRLTRVVRMIKTNAILRHFEENTLSQATMTQYSLKDVQTIQATERAFAALLPDGHVVTWGDAVSGGDSGPVQDLLKDVKQIQATKTAFAAILGDGSVVSWGDPRYGGDHSAVKEQLKRVQHIQSTGTSFAAIREDGCIVTWGYAGFGGDSSLVKGCLQDVQQIQATMHAFAAILRNGSVVTWGDARFGGDSSLVQKQLQNVQHIQAAERSFAAILADRSVVTWGDPFSGGDCSSVSEHLQDVQRIQAAYYAFAAILGDGSVVTWGDPRFGGDSSSVQGLLRHVQHIQATERAFAAILQDGSVVTWGDGLAGGDSRAVKFLLKDVQQIQATDSAFAAILGDGSVVTWGDVFSGGDNSSVKDQLRTAAPDADLSTDTAFRAPQFKILGVMLLEQHVIACLWFGVGYLNMTPGATWLSMSGLQQQDVWYQYTTCLHWAFAQLGVGNVEIEAYNVPERAFCICVAVLSLITTATLVSTITSLMTALDKKRNDEMHQFRNLHRFLRHSEIPEELSDRITRLLQYAYHAQTDCTSDSDVPILKLLSKGLRSELQFTRYESALEKLTFLRSLMSSDKQTPQEGKVLQSLATKALYTVEFAQNDVVFCQGGIADAAFLVLSGRFRYTRRMKGFIISDEHWVAEVCLWTPWLYVGEMVAKEIGRSVAVEVEAFCECIGAVWEMRQQATYFAQMVVEDLNTQQVEDLTDVQINALEADVGPRPSRDQRRDSRISSLLSWNASLDQQGSCLRNLCCCRRQGNMVEDHADAVAKSAGVSAPVPVMLEDRTVISSTLVIRSISPGKLTMRSSTLGLLVSPDDNPQYLVVDDVRGPSLISEWNAAQPEELRIHQGDQILAVNGVAGWWEEMLRTIQVQASKPGDLRLRVSQLDHPFADSACDAEPSSIPFGACLAAMSLRMFTGWFQGAEAEAAEAPMAGYAAPVKNTFIHYECDEQPDYRPARSGPARVEDPPTSPLPAMSTISSQEEAETVSSVPADDAATGGGSPSSRPPPIPPSLEVFEPPPVKNTFIHFDDDAPQPDYTSTVSGPAVLRSVASPPQRRAAEGCHNETLAEADECQDEDEEQASQAALPSIGSVGHAAGTCRPCAHAWPCLPHLRLGPMALAISPAGCCKQPLVEMDAKSAPEA